MDPEVTGGAADAGDSGPTVLVLCSGLPRAADVCSGLLGGSDAECSAASSSVSAETLFSA